jgi:hypothetical protein
MNVRQMHAAVDSACDENAQLMCERSNYGRVLVATEVMALWRRSGDGRALRTLAPLAMERRTIHSGLSIGREESQGIVSRRSLTTGLLGSLDAHLRGLGVILPDERKAFVNTGRLSVTHPSNEKLTIH